MSVYLRYRLGQVGIATLRQVAVQAARDSWAFHQIADELCFLFPDIDIVSAEAFPGETGISGFDLWVLPYEGGNFGPRAAWRAAQVARRHRARHILLYGLTFRTLDFGSPRRPINLALQRMDHAWAQRIRRRLRRVCTQVRQVGLWKGLL